MGESLLGGGKDFMVSSNQDKEFSTQHQLRIWDALLEARIRMQKILLDVNKLPQNETFKRVVEGNTLVSPSSTKAVSSVQEFVENLLQLQEALTLNHPEINGAINKKRKAKCDEDDDEDEGVEEGDVEITSEEDEGVEDSDKVKTTTSDQEDEREKITPPSVKTPKKKKRKLEEYSNRIDTEFKKFSSYRDETITKWNEKTQMSFGKFRGKNSSSVPQIPTLKQISHILSDRPRLIKAQLHLENIFQS